MGLLGRSEVGDDTLPFTYETQMNSTVNPYNRLFKNASGANIKKQVPDYIV